MRTQEEIFARYVEVRPTDYLGFKAAVLLAALDFEHARPALTESATAESWGAPATEEELRAEAVRYLAFAFEKAQDHRGISASRSVNKLTEYAWLLGRDDVVAAMNAAHYPQYGVPMLFAFASGFGLPLPEDEDLVRMARGEPCTVGCVEGCGS